MVRKLLSTTLALSVAFGPMAHADTFVFRYKSPLVEEGIQPPVDEEYGVGNDVQAYYVAPVGSEFEKVIPVATHDVVEWRKDSGDFPSGISLDEASGRMTGTPTVEGKSELLYHGYDSAGHRIARARIFFTVFDPVGKVARVDFYAHTGQYFYDKLPTPEGLQVYRWEPIASDPAGMSMLGDGFQGTPAKAGTYGIGWRGYDYTGREIAFVYGEFLVQDGPVIDFVPDETIDIQQAEMFATRAVVQHAIGTLKFNLVAEGADPVGLSFDNLSGQVSGAFQSYDTTAKYHFTVVDKADGTPGRSNSFTLATYPAAADLSALGNLTGYVNRAFLQPLSVPGFQPGATWIVKQGTLPAGISLDATTGLISGTPTRMEVQDGIVIAATAPSMTDSESPAFKFTVRPEALEFETTPTMVRTNTPFSTQPPDPKSGKVPPYEFETAQGTSLQVARAAVGTTSTLSAQGMDLDRNSGVISSTTGVAEAGNYSATLRGSNGDNVVSKPFVQTIGVYNPLQISYGRPTTHRLQPLSADATVPDLSIAGAARYKLLGPKPAWLKFDESTGHIGGTPLAPADVGVVGPFSVTVSDAIGAKTSDPFYVEVEERLPLDVSTTAPEVERFLPTTIAPFAVKNAYGSTTFKLVSGSLGGTLAITSDGFLVGETTDPVGTTYSGLVVEVTDDDAMTTQTIPPFSVKVVEPKGLSSLTGSLDKTFRWTRGVPFRFTLPTPFNSYGNVTWSVAGLPAGVGSTAATGEVSGTVPDTGVTTYGFAVADETTRTPAQATLTLDIHDPMTVEADASYPLHRNSPAAIRPKVVDGIAPVRLSLSGTLPKGLTFDASSGSIMGTPSVEGAFGPYTLTVSDAAGTTKTAVFTIDVGAPLPFSIGYDAAFRFTPQTVYWLGPRITNPVGKVNFSVVQGRIPRGLALDNGSFPGFLIGRPTETGLFPVKIRATTDGGKMPYDLDYTIVVGLYGPVDFPGGTFKVHADTPFSYQTNPGNVLKPLTFSGGSGNPSTVQVDPVKGTISGVLSKGTHPNIVVSVKDLADKKGGATFAAVAIDKAHVSVPASASGKQWKPISVAAATTSNVIGTPSFSLDPASAPLPAGLSVNPVSGAVEGTPETVGSFPGVVVRLTDSFDGSTAASDPMTIIVAARDALSATMPGEVTLKRFASANVGATIENAVGQVSWTVSPALPAGVSMSAGGLDGSATELSDWTTYTATAVDSKGGVDGTSATTFRMRVLERDPLEVTLPSFLALKQWSPVNVKATVDGAVGAVAYVLSPSLPDGMTFANGVLSGTPSAPNVATTYTLMATDSKGGALGTSSFSFVLETSARDALGIDGPVSYEFSQFFAGAVEEKGQNVIGGAKWSISPALPSWAVMKDGTISGTPPAKSDPTNYVVTLSDDHDTTTRTIALSVGDRKPLDITSGPSIKALLNHAFNKKLATDNALGKVTWKLLSGTLPEGLAFDETTGTFFGTPTQFGVFGNVVVEAADEKGGLLQKSLTIDVGQDGSPITLSVKDLQTHVNTPLTTNAPVAGNLVGDAAYSAAGLTGTGISIDPTTGALTGSSPTVRSISAVVTVTDDTQRTKDAPVTITVLPAVTASQTDMKLVYNHNAAASGPSAVNAVGAVVWSLGSGTPPKGLTVDAATGKMVGKPKGLGDFGPLTLAATDSVGGMATSNPFSIHVDMNDDPIELTVADYTAYKGSYIHTPAPAYDNNLGAVTFFSPDAAALGLSINPKTGEITGRIDELKDVYINVSIRDAETTRVTSKPLHLRVVPDLKLTYPALMTSAQADPFSQPASVAYLTGTVTYSKGAGAWPDTFSVDPATGAIASSGVTAATGTYPGLTVQADIVSNGQQFSAVSNVFAIRVNPIDATPVISDVPSSHLFFSTVGEAGKSFSPTVVDSKLKKPWVYSGTTYRLNHDLSADTGLSFDPKTGTISGTATKAVIYRDLTVTVTSSEGDSDVTAPFWFGVAPAGDIALDPTFQTTVKTRVASPFVAPDIVWTNVIGNLMHSKTSGNIAFAVTPATGKLTNTNSTTTWVPNSYPVGVKVVDEFGRSTTATITVEIRPAVTVALSATAATVSPGFQYSAAAPLITVSATGVYGNATWVAAGLPTGLTLDPSSGAVVGRIDPGAYPNGTTFAPTFTATDSDDGASGVATAALTAATGHVYWRIYDTGTTGNWWWSPSGTNLGTGYSGADTAARSQGWGAIYSTFYEGSSYANVSALKVQNTALPDKGRNYSDVLWDVSGYADPWQIKRDASGAWWKVWKFKRPVAVTKVTWTWGDSNNAQFSAILRPNIQWSDDGTTWTNQWSSTLSRSTAGTQGTTCPAGTCQ